MLSGVNTGFAEANMYRNNTGGIAYVILLEAIQLTAALLWVDKNLPQKFQRFPLIIGGIDNLLLYLILGRIVIVLIQYLLGANVWTPMAAMNGAQKFWLSVVYLPFLTWPIFLTIALIGYWLRRQAKA